jgi:hypothetical protein
LRGISSSGGAVSGNVTEATNAKSFVVHKFLGKMPSENRQLGTAHWRIVVILYIFERLFLEKPNNERFTNCILLTPQRSFPSLTDWMPEL